MDVSTLLERHINARGGMTAISRLKSVYQRGTVTDRQGDVVQIEGWRCRPNLLRIHFMTAEIDATEGWDGRRGWEHFPWKNPQPVYTDGHASDALRRAADFDGPLVQPREKGHQIETLGECQIAGLPVYGLRVTLADGNVVTYYLHKDSYMVAATESVRPVHATTPVMTTTMFTDYRLVAGVIFPHYSVEVADDGAHNETYAWSEFVANPPVDQAFFCLPAPVTPSEN